MLMAFSFVYPAHSVGIWLYHTGKMVKIWFINIINAHFKFLIFYYLYTKMPLYEARTCGGIFRVTIEAIIDSHKKSNIVFIGYLLTIFFKVISINARVRNDEITCELFLLPFTHRISCSLNRLFSFLTCEVQRAFRSVFICSRTWAICRQKLCSATFTAPSVSGTGTSYS